jgi:uncharacterized protein
LEAPDFWVTFFVGFFAQLVDGALGMAYGTISSTVMLSFGVPPATSSALVHTAEMFTTGASGISHVRHKNVDWRLIRKLAPAGMVGAIGGALLVTTIPGKAITPFVALYLFCLGVLILIRAFRNLQITPTGWRRVIPLGVTGGFLDAAGGGGWGPIVTSTLLGQGHAPRETIGSVNTSEFLVASAATATFFYVFGTTDLSFAHELLWSLGGLILGGVLAAPFAAWVVKIIPRQALMIMVGVVIVCLSAWQMRIFYVWFMEWLARQPNPFAIG